MYARALGIWFHRVFSGDHTFDPGPFIPPPDPEVETQALLERLRQEVYASLSSAEAAQALAQAETQRRLEVEELAREAEAKVQEVQNHLMQI